MSPLAIILRKNNINILYICVCGASLCSQRHVAFLLRQPLISSKAAFWFALATVTIGLLQVPSNWRDTYYRIFWEDIVGSRHRQLLLLERTRSERRQRKSYSWLRNKDLSNRHTEHWHLSYGDTIWFDLNYSNVFFLQLGGEYSINDDFLHPNMITPSLDSGRLGREIFCRGW